MLRIWLIRLIAGGVGPISSFGFRFARNIILSRLLAPNEFGAATAITVMLAIGGMMSDVALFKFVVIDPSPKSVAVGHVLSVARAVIVALILFAAAPAIATFFGVSNMVGSFAIAACLSTIDGFAHLGIKTIQRNHRYGPDSIARLVSNLAAFAIAFPAIMLLRDHRAIIVCVATESSVYVILSHILASMPYQVSGDLLTIRRALAFGLPLAISGVGAAVISQFDRAMVGYWFGVTELAKYSVMLSMSVMPISVMLNVFGPLSLSYLLSEKPSLADRQQRYPILVSFYSILALLYTFCVVLTLDIITPLIFGPSFAISSAVHILISGIVYFRVMRYGAPPTLLLSRGRTRQLAFLNLSSGLELLIALGCVMAWPRIESMLTGILVGECLAYLLFSALSEEVVWRRSRLLIQAATTLIWPITMIGILALSPSPTWGARLVVVCGGLFALGAQIVIEFYRIEKFREVLSIALREIASNWHNAINRFPSHS